MGTLFAAPTWGYVTTLAAIKDVKVYGESSYLHKRSDKSIHVESDHVFYEIVSASGSLPAVALMGPFAVLPCVTTITVATLSFPFSYFDRSYKEVTPEMRRERWHYRS